MSSVGKRDYGIASATVSTMRTMGMTFSMGVVMVAFAVFLGDSPIEPSLYREFLTALHLIFGIFLVLSLAGAALSWRRKGLVTAP
jgi:hypothetical protein